jgi:hypothetical protein
LLEIIYIYTLLIIEQLIEAAGVENKDELQKESINGSHLEENRKAKKEAR